MIRKICRGYKYSRAIGFAQSLSYIFTRKGKLVKVTISGNKIYVRKGSKDLMVAVSCLFSHEFSALKFLLPGNFSGTIVDAGGYIGTAAIAFSNMFPKAEVITIEPSIDNYEVIKKNIAPFSKIKSINAALSSKNDSVSLNDLSTGEWGYSIIDIKDNGPQKKLHDVECVTLKNVAQDKHIDVLKLDIEGGEHDLLTNSLSDLKKIDIVIAELHERIVPNTEKKFFQFSKDRIIFKDNSEKYISVSK